MIRIVVALLALSCGLSTTQTSADFQLSTGATKNQSIPGPTRSYGVVVLNVPHMSQQPWLCVPTSAAMILAYFGRAHDPGDLKKRAEDYKPEAKRNKRFTFWTDMQHALREIGENWEIRNYPRTSEGFSDALDEIKASLRAGNPVMIDVPLDDGHTFVLIGFDDARKVVYIRDPALNEGDARILSYETLEAFWHNHRFGEGRSAFYSRR